MNKTTTHLLLLSIFIMTYSNIYTQNIGGIRTESWPSNLVCAGNTAKIDADITEPRSSYQSYSYQYWDGESWACCFGTDQKPYELPIPATGQLVEVQRNYTQGQTVYKTESVGYFYTPLTPSVGLQPTQASTCTANDGSISVSDISANFTNMARRFYLYNAQGAEIGYSDVKFQASYTFSNLAPGTYKVKISTGCTEAEQSVVLSGANLDAKINGPTSLCLGTGTELVATGGESYLWGTGATSSSITVLPSTPGVHTFSVQVKKGTCSQNAELKITVTPGPTATILGPDKACYNGSVTLSASGTGTYQWSTGATTSSISLSLLQSNQTYGLTITDPITKCSSADQHDVIVLDRPTLNDIPNSICAGGSVNLSVSGGSSYSWNVGGTTASIVHSPSEFTEYRVTVTDANGCVYSLSKTVNVEALPRITFGGGTSICAGQSLNVTAFGGQSYRWDYNNATTATITVSPTQNTTYTVTATSAGGCTTSAQRVITIKPSPLGKIDDAPGSICPGQSVTLVASGGNTYRWTEGNATTASITVSPTQNTNYTVSITNTEGCTVVKSHSIAVNISGLANNDGPLTCSKTTVTLLGSSSALGATYRWKNASGVEIATTPSTTVSTPGVYTLEISAAGGCTFTTATEVLLDRQIPIVSASNAGVITCTQPSINLLGSSSLSPASYEWRNSAGNLIASTLNASTTQAGSYTLKVTAANGCSATASTVVTADVATPQANIQHDGPLTCTKTSVTLNAISSTPNLQYTWRNSGGSIIASNSSSVVVTATGTYQLEARGSNGCTTTVGTSITQSGNFPTISVNNPESISCISPSATISGNSTTPGVSYAWYNPNGKLMSTQKSFAANIAGTYTLKVTSAEGCVSSASTTLNEVVFDAQRTTLNVGGSYTNSNFAQGELTCTKSSIHLSASARSAGYSISVYWTNAAGTVLSNYSYLNVSTPGYYYLKQNNCPLIKEILIKENRPAPVVQIAGEKLACVGKNTTLTASGGSQYYWSTGASTTTITTENIYSPTTYTVTVSSGNCNTVANVTVDNHPKPVVNITGPTSLCAGTFVTLTASGGYTYKWSHNNATTESINVAPLVPTTYTVTATSDKGCTATKSHVISTVKSQPNDFNLNGLPTSAFCGEAPLNISVINPNSNYTWKWSTGETTTFLQTTLTSSQTVSVTATRNNGCTRTKAIPITVNPKPAGLIQGAEIHCAGDSTILTTPAGETYLWSTGANTQSIVVRPTSDQTYRVTVSNAGGTCSASFEKTVTVPASLNLSHDLAGEDDCIPNNAAVIPMVSGGTGSITLGIIRTGELYASPNLDGLRSGTYVLRAVDTKGCLALDEVLIQETPIEISALTLSKVDDCIPGNTQLNISTKGDRLPLVYRLDGVVQSGATITLPREEKTYTIEVADAAGCVVSREEYYEDYDAVRVYEDNISPVTDCSTPNGAIHFVYVGKPGTEQKDYRISVDGGTTWHQATNLVLNLRPGLYQTAARNDLAGCVVQGPQVQITAPYCLPEAGFTKSTLHITSPTQRIALPWRVDKRAWGNADKPFSLRIYRVEDGKPHFVDPNIATATEPLEKSVEPGAGFTIEYAVDFEGSDERELVLQPNAADHLEPGTYTFMMEGEGVAVDPFRKKMTVYIDFEGRVIVETFSVCAGDPITLVVKDPMPGECYSWEGVDAGNVSKVTIPNHIPGKTYRVWRLNNLKLGFQDFVGDDLANADVPYKLEALPSRVCKGNEVKLTVTGATPGWTYEWYDGSTGSTAGQKFDRPEVTTTYKLWATSPNGCRYPLSVTVEVDDLTGVKINPAMPVACPGGNAKLTLQGLPSGYSVGWFYTEPGSFDELGAGTGVTVNAAKIGKWRALISGACTALMTTQDPARNKNVEVKEASAVNIGNLVQSMGGFYFIPGIVTYGDKAADLANFPAVPEMGSGGEVEVLGKERDIQVALDAFSSGQIKDMVQAIIAEDAWINEAGTKKVFIVTPNAFCQKQDVLAEALKKIREYDLGYVVVPVSGKGVYVINTTFKQPAMSPVSNAHRDFIKARVECMKASGEANSSQKLLGVVFNTLIDNYEASYEALAEAMVGVDCRQVVLLGEDPRPELRETDCKTLKANTRFFNAAALVVTLNAGFGPIFNKSSYIVQSSQKGCLVGYKNNSGALYSGRYYVKPEGYYHVGFHPQVKDYNQKNLANFPVVSAFQNAVVWFAKDLGDLNDAKAENYQVHEITGFALKASGSTGAGNYVADGICVNCASSGYGNKTFNMQSSKITAEYFFKSKPDLKPEELTFWNVKLDQPFPREQVESSTDPNDPLSGGFIIQIPREAPAAPITLYVRYKKGESVPYSIHYLDQCQWKPYDYKTDQYLSEENKLIFSRLLHLFSEIWAGGHFALDVAGIFFPIADIANAAWYFYQKSPIEGTLSLIGAIPLFGDVVLFSVKGALKLFVKVGDKTIELLTLLKKLADGTEIDMAAILKGLNSSDIPSSDLSRLFQALNAPQFADTDAKALLQAFQADPQGMAKLWSVADGLGSSLDNFADFVKWAEDVKHLDFIKSNPLSYKIYQQAVSDGLPTSRIATLFADLRNPANKLDLMAELLKDPGLVRVWALVDEVGSSLKLDTDVLKRLKADLDGGDLEQFIRARGKSGLAAWNILDGAKKCFN